MAGGGTLGVIDIERKEEGGNRDPLPPGLSIEPGTRVATFDLLNVFRPMYAITRVPVTW